MPLDASKLKIRDESEDYSDVYKFIDNKLNSKNNLDKPDDTNYIQVQKPQPVYPFDFKAGNPTASFSQSGIPKLNAPEKPVQPVKKDYPASIEEIANLNEENEILRVYNKYKDISENERYESQIKEEENKRLRDYVKKGGKFQEAKKVNMPEIEAPNLKLDEYKSSISGANEKIIDNNKKGIYSKAAIDRKIDNSIKELEDKIAVMKEDVVETVIPIQTGSGQFMAASTYEKSMLPRESEAIYVAERQIRDYREMQATIKDAEINGADFWSKGGWNNFFSKIGRDLPDLTANVLSSMLRPLFNSIQTYGVISKQGENVGKDAIMLATQYKQAHQNDIVSAQKIASGATQSLEFMAEYLITGGIGSSVRAATSKAVGKAITKALAKQIATKGGKIASKFAEESAGLIAGSIVQSAIIPKTYAGTFENMINGDGFLDGFAKSYWDNFKEVLSEGVGEYLPDIPLPGMKTKKFAKQFGIQGLFQEWAEEQFGMVLTGVTGDGWDEFLDPESQLLTLASISLMQLPFQSIGAAGYIANGVQLERINNAYRKNFENLGNFSTNVRNISMDIQEEIFENGYQGAVNSLKYLNDTNELTEKEKDALAKFTVVSLPKIESEKAKAGIKFTVSMENQSPTATDRPYISNVKVDNNSVPLPMRVVLRNTTEPVDIDGNGIIFKAPFEIDVEKSPEYMYYTDSSSIKHQVKTSDIVKFLRPDEATAIGTQPVSSAPFSPRPGMRAAANRRGVGIIQSITPENSAIMSFHDETTGDEYVDEVPLSELSDPNPAVETLSDEVLTQSISDIDTSLKSGVLTDEQKYELIQKMDEITAELQKRAQNGNLAKETTNSGNNVSESGNTALEENSKMSENTVSELTEEQQKAQRISIIEAAAPKQIDPKTGQATNLIDYDALFQANPVDFAELWDAKHGQGAARNALQRSSDGITKQIEIENKKIESQKKKVAKAEESGFFNAIAAEEESLAQITEQANIQIEALTEKKSAIDNVIEERYNLPEQAAAEEKAKAELKEDVYSRQTLTDSTEQQAGTTKSGSGESASEKIKKILSSETDTSKGKIKEIIDDYTKTKKRNYKGSLQSAAPNSFVSISKEQFDKLIDVLKKTGLAKMIVTDAAKMREVLGEKGIKAFQAITELSRVNVMFNEELQQQIAGTLPANHTYKLGNSGAILQAAGIPNLPIELQASRLSDKSMQAEHPFDLSEVENLPQAIQQPLAVFDSATKDGSFVILTELLHGGKNFVVAIQANKKSGKIEVNSIRSIHYRTSNVHIANRINDNLARYADKQKMREFFSKQQYNSADVKGKFSRAAKVIQNFENPKVEDDFFRMQAIPIVEDATETQIKVNGKWYARNIINFGSTYKIGEFVPDLIESVIRDKNKKQTPLNNQLIEDAKREFGITKDFNEAGYLLTDGTMLDFSEKKDGGTPGTRNQDHREISVIGDNVDLVSFMAMGNIRLSPESGGFEITGKPTPQQIPTLKNYIRNFGGNVIVDFSTPGEYTTEYGFEYSKTDPNKVIADIERYYDSGIKPTNNIRYMSTPKGEVYGFVTEDGTVYIDPNNLNANTPIHEFGHLLWSAMPEDLRQEITGLLKQTPAWEKLSDNPAYANLKTDEQKSDEIFNTILGNRGENSIPVQEIIGKDITLFARITNSINKFWEWVKAAFGNKEAKINRIADMTLGELLSGQKLTGRSLTEVQDKIEQAEKETDTNPTEAQKKAGNYKMGHVNIQGFDISIENMKGSVRSGVSEDGKKWSNKMANTYGYFGKTESRDGDHIDLFLGNNPLSEKVFVVDQINPNTKAFDEHKVMFGFDNIKEAEKAYYANYEKGWKGLGDITEVEVEDFRKWAGKQGARVKPFAEYNDIKGNNDLKAGKQQAREIEEFLNNTDEGKRLVAQTVGETAKAKEQADKVSAFIEDVLTGKVKNDRQYIDLPEYANKLAEKELGHTIKSHRINANEIRHIKNNHGENGKKNTVNSIPLRNEDIALMPYIMAAPDRVEKGSTATNGTESVKYYKTLNNGYVVVVEREGNFDTSEMETITMWVEKKPSTNGVNARNNRPSPERPNTLISSEDTAKIHKDFETVIEKEQKRDILFQIKQQQEKSSLDILNEITEIDTGITRIDEDFSPEDSEYEQKLVLRPIFVNTLEYYDNTNPYIEEHSSLKEAYKAAEGGRLTDFSDKGYYDSQTEVVKLYFRQIWVDKNGYEIEELDKISLNDAEDDYDYKKIPLIKKFYADFEYGIEQFSHERQPKEDDVLRKEVINKLPKEIIKEYQYDDTNLKIEYNEGKWGKYNIVTIFREITEEEFNSIDYLSETNVKEVSNKYYQEVETIVVRVSDHSYNPANNSSDAKFLSLTITDNDPTATKFMGKYNMYYDSRNTADEIIDDLNEKIIDIIDTKLYNIKPKKDRFQISITPESKAKVTYVPSSKQSGQEVAADQSKYDFDVTGITEANAQEMQVIKETEDVSRDDQIFIYDGLGVSNSLYGTILNKENKKPDFKDFNGDIIAFANSVNAWNENNSENNNNFAENNKENGSINLSNKREGIQNLSSTIKEKKNEDGSSTGYNRDSIEGGAVGINALSLAEEQERIAGGRRNVEASLLLRGDVGSDGSKQSYSRERQEEILKEYAQREGGMREYGNGYVVKNQSTRPSNGGFRFQAVPAIEPVPIPKQESGENLQDYAYRVATIDDVNKKYLDARASLENKIKANKAFRAFINTFHPLAELQNTVEKAKGIKLRAFENAFEFTQRQKGLNTTQINDFQKTKMEPITNSIKALKRAGKKTKEIEDYIKVKSGEKRNERMRANPDNAKKDTRKDYSGIFPVLERNGYSRDDASVRRFIEDFEKGVTRQEIDNLWASIKDATDFILECGYESGLISKATYDDLLKRKNDFYVPLRGFAEGTMEDIYDYDKSGGEPGIQDVMRKAEGRESEAEDPVAYISILAETEIIRANKNKMKLRLLNMLLNNPMKEIYTVAQTYQIPKIDEAGKEVLREVYYEKLKDENGDTVIEEVYYVPRGEKMEEVRNKISKEEYKEAIENNKKPKPNFPKRILPWMERQHQVIVFYNGKKYVITFGGKEGATLAKSINGTLLNEAQRQQYQNDILVRSARWNSMINTQFAPEFFIYTNAARDILLAALSNFLSNGGKSTVIYLKSLPLAYSAMISNGKAANAETKKYYDEFIHNGVETGYSSIREFEKHMRDIQKAIETNGVVNTTMRGAGKVLGNLPRASEGMTRLATYIMARNSGDTIEKSILKAKDVTVNFEIKGSGETVKFGEIPGIYLLGLNKIHFIRDIPVSARLFQAYFSFFNSSIQGTNKIYRMSKEHKRVMATFAASITMTGALMPMIARGLSGDDDPDDSDYTIFSDPVRFFKYGGGFDKINGMHYYDGINEFVRRNNLVICWGKDRFFTIPIPQLLRTLYGIGEIMQAELSGNLHHENFGFEQVSYEVNTGIFLLKEIAVQFLNDFSPLAAGSVLLSENKRLADFSPSGVVPVVETLVDNIDFLGRKIAKETPFNEDEPEFKRTGNNTGNYWIALSKYLNNKTGGDDYTKGMINFNPAKLQHLVEGYTGGLGRTLTRGYVAATRDRENSDMEYRDIPLIGKAFVKVTGKNMNNQYKSRYFDYLNDARVFNRRMEGYENDNDLEALSKLIGENGEKEDKWIEFAYYEKEINKLNMELKEYKGELKQAQSKEEEKEIKKDIEETENDMNDIIRESVQIFEQMSKEERTKK